MSGKYDDIINLPRHISSKHRPMSLRDRAAQFAPFAALSGHSAALSETARLTTGMVELSEDAKAVLDMKQQMLAAVISQRPEVTVTCFLPDQRKEGGSYITLTGRVKAIDDMERVLIMEDGQRLEFDRILDMESEIFPELC